MTEETAHSMILKAFSVSERVTFMFQGGEPTLRGLPFYRDFVSFANKRGKSYFAIQSNGSLIDDQWAEFFKSNNFLVGLSLDGNKKIHDLNRLDKDGSGSYKKVFKAFQILNRHKVEFNVVSVVTKESVKRLDDITRFLEANNIRFSQFIPCLDPIKNERGKESYSLDPTSYGLFLSGLFSWYYRKWKENDYYSVRFFDNLVLLAMGMEAEECGMRGECSAQYVVEADGSVFPCDFYVLDGYRLGSVITDNFDDLDKKRKELSFIEKSRKVSPECKVCPYFRLCKGGCRRDRENFESGEIERTYLCKSYKVFFENAMEKINIIALSEKAHRVNKKLT